jgi:hypothetical protein
VALLRPFLFAPRCAFLASEGALLLGLLRVSPGAEGKIRDSRLVLRRTEDGAVRTVEAAFFSPLREPPAFAGPEAWPLIPTSTWPVEPGTYAVTW